MFGKCLFEQLRTINFIVKLVEVEYFGDFEPPGYVSNLYVRLTAALFERFSSRNEGDYSNKLLSAMRREFGGHAEARREEDR